MFLYWGCGLHIDTLTITQKLEITKWLFIEEIVYYCVHWVIKSAFLLFYMRLSPKRGFRMAIHIAGGFNTAILIINVYVLYCIALDQASRLTCTTSFLACFQCVPFEAILKPGSIPGAKCIPTMAVLLVPSILVKLPSCHVDCRLTPTQNIFEDIFILLIPVSTLWSLQMSFRHKATVISLVAFGSSSVIIACCRLSPLLELGTSKDSSWVLGKMVIVAALEIQFAIISVNLPSLKSLWVRITGKNPTGSGRAEGYSGQKGSKGSSFNRMRTFGSGDGPYRAMNGKKGRRGSITQLEQGITATESEEELCRQGGIPMRAPSRIAEGEEHTSKSSKDYEVKSAQVGVDEVSSSRYPKA
ncbi:hypothetical protein ACJQWK_00607 [Exserohilum turcicum]